MTTEWNEAEASCFSLTIYWQIGSIALAFVIVMLGFDLLMSFCCTLVGEVASEHAPTLILSKTIGSIEVDFNGDRGQI